MNKHFDGSISHSTSDNKKLITFPVAHLYVQHAGEAEWQGLRTPGRCLALPAHRLCVCCLKESPQVQPTKYLGLTRRDSDHDSTAQSVFFLGISLGYREKKKGKEDSLVLTILQVEKWG